MWVHWVPAPTWKQRARQVRAPPWSAGRLRQAALIAPNAKVPGSSHLSSYRCLFCSWTLQPGPLALTLWPPVQRAGQGVKAPCLRGGRRRSPGWGVGSALPGAHALDTIGEAVLSVGGGAVWGEPGAQSQAAAAHVMGHLVSPPGEESWIESAPSGCRHQLCDFPVAPRCPSEQARKGSMAGAQGAFVLV